MTIRCGNARELAYDKQKVVERRSESFPLWAISGREQLQQILEANSWKRMRISTFTTDGAQISNLVCCTNGQVAELVRELIIKRELIKREYVEVLAPTNLRT